MDPAARCLLSFACRHAQAARASMGFPDDELMLGVALTEVLNARGLEVKLDVSSVVLSQTAWRGIEMTSLVIGDEVFDVFGRAGAWQDLASRRVDYLVQHHGFVPGVPNEPGVWGNLNHTDVIQARGPGFLSQCQTLARAIELWLDDPKTPFPAAIGDAMRHGGPLVQVRYYTRLGEFEDDGNLEGVGQLLQQWFLDEDAARPSDLPQRAALALIAGNFKNEDAVVELLEKSKSFGLDLSGIHTAANDLVVMATSARHQKVARYLVEQGLDLNPPTAGHAPSLSALCTAIINRLDDLAEHFLAHGARVNPENSHESSPLKSAVVSGQLPWVEKLLARGADPKTVDESGGTLLHVLAHRPWQVEGAQDIAVLMLEAGVDPHQVDGQGRSALDVLKNHTDPGLCDFVIAEHAAICMEQSNPGACPSRPRPRL